MRHSASMSLANVASNNDMSPVQGQVKPLIEHPGANFSHIWIEIKKIVMWLSQAECVEYGVFSYTTAWESW